MKSLLFVIIPIISFTQNSSITQSNFYERKNAKISNYYFSINDDMIYVKLLNNNIILERFSLSKNMLIESNVFPALDKNEKIEKIIKLGDKLYVFYSFWDKKINWNNYFQ